MPELPPVSPIASQPLSVVLLARNQAASLEQLLAAWIGFLDGLEHEYELILVDDGSTDGTGELAEKLASAHRNVVVQRLERAEGDGAALRKALAAARHPLLFYTLADPHFQPADLGKLLQRRHDPDKPDLEIDHVHILSGYRGGQRMPSFWLIVRLLWRCLFRVIFGHFPDRLPGWLGWKRHAAAPLARMVFGLRYRDVACPFRLVRREIFSRIPLQSSSLFVHVEILAKANYLGLIMGEEVPLEPGHYPPLTTEMSDVEFRQMLVDARRVIRQPEFGPVMK